MDTLIDDLDEPFDMNANVFVFNVFMSVVIGIWIYFMVLGNSVGEQFLAWFISIITTNWLIAIAYMSKHIDERII